MAATSTCICLTTETAEGTENKPTTANVHGKGDEV